MVSKNIKVIEDHEETILITVPDVIAKDKLVIYDHQGKPLQRKVGF